MRLLVDEGVDVRILATLKRWGHNVRRGPLGAKNGAVIRLAQGERRILLTRDSDFSNIALYPPSRYAGIIHIAIHPPWPEKIVPALQRLLASVPESGFSGKTFILEEAGYRRFP